MLFIIILCSCSVPSQLWAASVSHWVKRIARCKYKKQAGVGSCFGDYSDFSYFFPGLFRLLGWVLGAVLGIFVVSATFSQIFSGFWAGFWVLFWGFLQFQLLFPGSFPTFWLDFGCCFGDFCSFSYFFPGLFQLLGWVLGAVLEVLGITATKIALMKQH